MQNPSPLTRLLIAAALIAAGLGLRFYGHHAGVSAFVVKYGGSALWASMVYFLIALLMPSRAPKQILFIAGLICALVEILRLYHTPALDVVRLTVVGQILFGRIFSFADFIAYAVGLALAFGLDLAAAQKFFLRRAKKSSRRRR